MIKFAAVGMDGGTILGIGLSEENVIRLKAGMPIMFAVDALIPEIKAKVCVFYGETEEKMVEDLKGHGITVQEIPSSEEGECSTEKS